MKPLPPAEKRWALIAVALIAVVSAIDWITPPKRIYLGLLVAPPLVAAVRCRPWTTVWITGLTLAAALALGAHADIWLTPDHMVRVSAILISGVLGTVAAVARQRTELSLAASETRYRALADGSDAGVWQVTPDDRTLYVNPTMCRMLEITGPEELAGQTFHSFFTRESLEIIGEEHAKRALGIASTYEAEIVGRRGGRRHVLVSGAPLLGSDGQLESMIGTVVDVTERRRLARIQTATYRISQAAHVAPTLQGLFPAIHTIVGELMPAGNFYIALHDAASDTISFPYFVDERDEAPAPKKPGRGLTEYVLRTGLPQLVTPEVMLELERRGEVELIGGPSIDWLGVPLKTDGNTIGVLVVQTYTEGVRYTHVDRDVLQFVSTQVAMAIERKRTEEALRESSMRLAQSQAIAHLGSWELDLSDLEDINRNALWWSDETFRIFGYEPGDVAVSNQLFLRAVPQDDAPRIEAAMAQALRDGDPYFIEHAIIRPDGSRRIVQEQSTIVRDAAGRPLRMVGTVRDVTDERRLADQLRQAQKMEAVGRLAGGMAHDFNNLLTAVLAANELLAEALPPDLPYAEDIATIRKAAQHGAELTHKLLAFSRRQPLELRAVALGALVGEFARMARRVVPEDVEVLLRVSAPDAVVRADPVAVEQILMNLVTNASDAMPSGGTLTVQVDRASVDEERCRAWGWGEPGEYVALSVCDTGTGMDEETRRRIFEPFYTTKPVGVGTGLGMAMVYGLVKQHFGWVSVDSERGRGTTVCTYFPATARPADAAHAASAPGPEMRGGKETILVVEDNVTLRRTSTRVLERFGYTVLTAADGHEALALIESTEPSPHLIISDVVMPRMSGPEMLSRMRDAGRNPRILFTSGYTERDVAERATLQPGTPFLTKPWTIPDLLHRVRELLDAPEPSAR